MSSSDQTINLPQLVLILVLGGLAIRYFFFSNGSTSSNSSTPSAVHARAREADVERIQQMFPQVPRRSIMWDLQRNGGNVVATTERILSGRGLENPPQSFQPPQPASVPSPVSSTLTANKPVQPDLITRYNLKSRLAQQEEQVESKPETQAWSQNKGERQALLQRRREEMILTARRKMEAKVAAEASLGKPEV